MDAINAMLEAAPPSPCSVAPGAYREILPQYLLDDLKQLRDCLSCRRSKRGCQDMLVRLLNFVLRARTESQIQGSFMISRLTASMGHLAERSLVLKSEHLSAIGMHIDVLLAISGDALTCSHTTIPPGPAFEMHFERVEALVRNLEALAMTLCGSGQEPMPCRAGKAQA